MASTSATRTPRWRVLEVHPGTTVALTTCPFGQIDRPRSVGFVAFGQMFDRDAHGLRAYPYWITVRDGVVVEIEQQYIP
jgi:hypothetical protein